MEENNIQIIQVIKRRPGRPKKEKSDVEQEPTKTRGRPRKYEQGSAQYIKDSKYNTQYYHQTNKDIKCPICDKKTTTRTLNQHQQTLKCKLIKLNIQI